MIKIELRNLLCHFYTIADFDSDAPVLWSVGTQTTEGLRPWKMTAFLRINFPGAKIIRCELSFGDAILSVSAYLLCEQNVVK